MESKKINGCRVYAPNNQDELFSFTRNKNVALIAVNAEKLLNVDTKLRSFINSNVAYPDGIGAVYGLTKKGIKHAYKIAGCELWLNLIYEYRDENIYLIGGTDRTIKATVEKLLDLHPSCKIVGYRNGFFSNKKEYDALIDDLEVCEPSLVFVAMGSPLQEAVIERLKEKYPAIYMGLGGSFDVFVGSIKRAPTFLVKSNLEWLYRLIQEPWRIRRQFRLILFYVYVWIGRF